MADSDFLRILAGIAFHHRCQSKGLCLRSPARRLTRPLASATAGVFRSYRRTPKPSPRVAHSLKPSPWRSAVLNDTPVACQIRGPTDPQGDRCPHTPAASAATYPLRCFAPQWARFDNRHSTSAPTPTLTASAAAAQEVQAIPEPTTTPAAPIPRDQHRQICTCPPRAKGPLDRRSKRLSFPHFFLRRKKCGRRRPPPRQGKIDSPPQRRKRSICLRWG